MNVYSHSNVRLGFLHIKSGYIEYYYSITMKYIVNVDLVLSENVI